LGSVLPGTTQEVAQAAQAIMNTDDVNALDDIRRTTKSRGIKVMANRKIARINRMKSNA
jgi:flavodoxin